MTIQPKIKEFYLLPTIAVNKYINTLTKESKKAFNYNWDNYYIIKIGILFWAFEFKIN